MKFVYPEFLFALSAISIPVIIHLFNFRKFKRIIFTNVRFLKEVKEETQSKSKLKHLLVLLTRILAISFLVFAFAQPYIPKNNSAISEGEKVVSVFIDNSFSMNAENEKGNLFEQAKTTALQIINGYSSSDRFQLLTNNFEGRHQRLVTKTEFSTMVNELEINAASKNLNEIVARQMDAISTSEVKSKKSFIISDFQKTMANIEAIKVDSLVDFSLIPLKSNTINNVFIDSIWFKTPYRLLNQPEKLTVRIKNSGLQSLEDLPLKFSINNVQKSFATINIAENSYADSSIYFTNSDRGLQKAELSIKDAPVNFDDHFFMAFNIVNKINILSILPSVSIGKVDFFKSIFGNDSSFNYNSVSEKNIDFSSLDKFNFIVLFELDAISSGLNQELKKFVQNGGSILIIPSEKIDFSTYNSFTNQLGCTNYTDLVEIETKVFSINLDHPLYKDVFEKIPKNLDYPTANAYYNLSKSAGSNEEVLLKLQNNHSFLNKFNFGNGKIYECAVPLNTEKNNFSKHALFVTSVLRMAEFSSNPQKLYYTIGLDEAIEIPNFTSKGETVFHLMNDTKTVDIIPDHNTVEGKTEIFCRGQISTAGTYNLYYGSELITAVSFNYDKKESDLSCYSKENLKEKIKNSSLVNFSVLENNISEINNTIQELNSGKKYWKLCILLALVFLGLEVLILRFFKS